MKNHTCADHVVKVRSIFILLYTCFTWLFSVDVTQAGEGQLEIMVNRGAVANTVKMLRKGVFLVHFVPRDTRAHVVDIKFNGQLLPREFNGQLLPC